MFPYGWNRYKYSFWLIIIRIGRVYSLCTLSLRPIKELWYSMVFHIQVKMLLELIYFNIDAIYILI